jgi:hypothetical protein
MVGHITVKIDLETGKAKRINFKDGSYYDFESSSPWKIFGKSYRISVGENKSEYPRKVMIE